MFHCRTFGCHVIDVGEGEVGLILICIGIYLIIGAYMSATAAVAGGPMSIGDILLAWFLWPMIVLSQLWYALLKPSGENDDDGKAD